MADKALKISSTMEDYLEAVYSLEAKNGFARVSDIAASLGVKKSSVNTALKSLSQRGMISHQRYGSATLTTDGRRLAGELQDKEDVLFNFFTRYLFIDPRLAREEACRLEHSITKATFHRLVDFFSFIDKVLSGGSRGCGVHSLERFMKRRAGGKKKR